MLVGLEIPLLLRLLRDRLVFRELVAQVLSLDYVGALAASLLFPLLLVPRLGLIRTSLLVGLANAAVGLWSTWIFRRDLAAPGFLRAFAVAAVLVLGGGAVAADRITDVVGGPPLRRRDHPGPHVALPAHRAHAWRATTSACSSTATCSSPRATSTATTRRSCTRRWPRTRTPGACWSWAAATASPCARSCATRPSSG